MPECNPAFGQTTPLPASSSTNMHNADDSGIMDVSALKTVSESTETHDNPNTGSTPSLSRAWCKNLSEIFKFAGVSLSILFLMLVAALVVVAAANIALPAVVITGLLSTLFIFGVGAPLYLILSAITKYLSNTNTNPELDTSQKVDVLNKVKEIPRINNSLTCDLMDQLESDKISIFDSVLNDSVLNEVQSKKKLSDQKIRTAITKVLDDKWNYCTDSSAYQLILPRLVDNVYDALMSEAERYEERESYFDGKNKTQTFGLINFLRGRSLELSTSAKSNQNMEKLKEYQAPQDDDVRLYARFRSEDKTLVLEPRPGTALSTDLTAQQFSDRLWTYCKADDALREILSCPLLDDEIKSNGKITLDALLKKKKEKSGLLLLLEFNSIMEDYFANSIAEKLYKKLFNSSDDELQQFIQLRPEFTKDYIYDEQDFLTEAISRIRTKLNYSFQQFFNFDYFQQLHISMNDYDEVMKPDKTKSRLQLPCNKKSIRANKPKDKGILKTEDSSGKKRIKSVTFDKDVSLKVIDEDLSKPMKVQKSRTSLHPLQNIDVGRLGTRLVPESMVDYYDYARKPSKGPSFNLLRVRESELADAMYKTYTETYVHDSLRFTSAEQEGALAQDADSSGATNDEATNDRN